MSQPISKPQGFAQSQQYSIPTTAAEVRGPASGTAMTTAYVQTVGRMAYLWGWPLVNWSIAPSPSRRHPSPACWAEWCRSHSTGTQC